jgi:hypothetical protein
MSTGEKRLTWGAIIDVLNVLEQHGYHRRGDQQTGRAIGLLSQLALTYEGAQDVPAGACAIEIPQATRPGTEPETPAPAEAAGLSAAQRKTVLAALDEAADHKRDLAANCADCPDQTCGNCQSRLAAALDYDTTATRLTAEREGVTPGPPMAPVRPSAVAEREAGQ